MLKIAASADNNAAVGISDRRVIVAFVLARRDGASPGVRLST
jgi:hypothetical protein